jgi:hypothetical protein
MNHMASMAEEEVESGLYEPCAETFTPESALAGN